MIVLGSWSNLRARPPRALAALAGAAALLVLLGGLASSRPDTPGPATPDNGCDAPGPATLQVTVAKVRRSKGLITAVLYGDNPDTFLTPGPRPDSIRVEARHGEPLLCPPAPAPGPHSG